MPAHAIEVVHGKVEGALADELLAFWLAHGALDERTGRQRLPLVAAVVRDGAGVIAGTASATPTEVALVGGRRLYVLRSFLTADAAADASVRPALERALHAALDRGTHRGDDDPLGVCLLLSAQDVAERAPDAQWTDPPLLYAGLLPDGRTVRVAWFDEPISIEPGAAPLTFEPPWNREEGPRLVVFDAQDEVTPEDVVAFWVREGALSQDAARARADEVLVVALTDEGAIAGVMTASLGRNDQLATDLWHGRVFVGEEHRRTTISVGLVVVGREELERRWSAGEERRAPGILFEVSNPMLKQVAPNAHWRPHDFWFVGENARGDHLRVHWFAGAPAPAPRVAQGST